jgi:O-methyltransferase domain/Dimerisation domain
MSTDGTPPALALLQQALGFWISRAICVVARLGIADLLKDGPLDTETLAAAAGLHAPSLYRVLRTLASVGIFAEGEDGRFGLTPQAEPLRRDAPDSIRDYILLVGEAWYSGPSDHLLHSVQTGRPAFERVHGADFFTFLARDPAAAAVFDAAMTSRSAQENAAIAAAYDFSGLGTIIDVGGGHGSFLAGILRAKSIDTMLAG